MLRAILLPCCLLVALMAGCLGDDGAGDDASDRLGVGGVLPIHTGTCVSEEDGPPPPPGEDATDIRPIDLIFGGSLKHADTRVLLVPPTQGDLGNPQNQSRSALAYLEATLEGIYAWEPAIELFVADHPGFSYLLDITVHVDIFDGTQTDTAGYDIIVGYLSTSGPAFRGVAISPGQDTQQTLNDAGIGDLVHYGNRYVLLSLFAAAPRAGQEEPDFPERNEVRGVTMHEFAHVWGLGHTTTWTSGCGSDLMNSPYGYVYGDGDPAGDGGERSPELCINSLNLYGLAHLYRWMPNDTWEGSSGNVSLPDQMAYERYCEVHDEAAQRVQALLAGRWDRVDGVGRVDGLDRTGAAAALLS